MGKRESGSGRRLRNGKLKGDNLNTSTKNMRFERNVSYWYRYWHTLCYYESSDRFKVEKTLVGNIQMATLIYDEQIIASCIEKVLIFFLPKCLCSLVHNYCSVFDLLTIKLRPFQVLKRNDVDLRGWSMKLKHYKIHPKGSFAVPFFDFKNGFQITQDKKTKQRVIQSNKSFCLKIFDFLELHDIIHVGVSKSSFDKWYLLDFTNTRHYKTNCVRFMCIMKKYLVEMQKKRKTIEGKKMNIIQPSINWNDFIASNRKENEILVIKLSQFTMSCRFIWLDIDLFVQTVCCLKSLKELYHVVRIRKRKKK
jgi:hypothetical protein